MMTLFQERYRVDSMAEFARNYLYQGISCAFVFQSERRCIFKVFYAANSHRKEPVIKRRAIDNNLFLIKYPNEEKILIIDHIRKRIWSSIDDVLEETQYMPKGWRYTIQNPIDENWLRKQFETDLYLISLESNSRSKENSRTSQSHSRKEKLRIRYSLKKEEMISIKPVPFADTHACSTEQGSDSGSFGAKSAVKTSSESDSTF